MSEEEINIIFFFYLFLELNPITRMLHLSTCEMIHFQHQTQYYFLFEVLECSWAEMLRRVNQAECLDDVINAHNDFLKSVQNGMLLDQSSYVCINLSFISQQIPVYFGKYTANYFARYKFIHVRKNFQVFEFILPFHSY